MKRGEVWAIEVREADDAFGLGVIVQEDAFDATDTVTICPLTTDAVNAPLIRLPIEPEALTTLDTPHRLMVDRLATIRRAKLRHRIGRLDAADLTRLNQAMIVFLGMAVSPKAGRKG